MGNNVEVTTLIIDASDLAIPAITDKTGKRIIFTENATGTTGGSFYDPDGPVLMTGSDRAGKKYEYDTASAKWLAVKHTVSFDVNGGTSSISDERIFDEYQVTKPADPAKYGHTFEGWFLDPDFDDEYVFSTPVTSDITLYAKWSINRYTVTLTADDGITGFRYKVDDADAWTAYSGAFTVTHGQKLEIEALLDTGYRFVKWADSVTDNPLTVTSVENDITYAPSAIRTYTVTLPSGTGYTVDADTGSSSPVDHGGSFTFVLALEASHSESVAVVKVDGTTVSLTDGKYTITNIIADAVVTVSNVVINVYTVTFVPNDAEYGSVSPASVSVPYGTTWSFTGGVLTFSNGTAATATPAAETAQYAYAFGSWSDESGTVSGAVSITAAFTRTVRDYTVSGTLTVTGGESAVGVTVSLGTYTAVTAADGAYIITGVPYGTSGDITASMTGYTQTGTASVTSISGNETGKDIALTINLYTVSFAPGASDASGMPDDQTVDHGSAAAKPPADPTRPGHDFRAWTLGGVDYVFTTPVTGDIQLTAAWTINTYEVTFGTDITVKAGEASVTSGQSLEHGIVLTVTAADKAGETYKLYANGDLLTGDHTLIAAVEFTVTYTVNVYTITFVSNGGSDTNPMILGYGTPITAPGDPVRDGYTFIGWFPALPSMMPAEDLTVTAVWDINQYTVTVTSEEKVTFLYVIDENGPVEFTAGPDKSYGISVPHGSVLVIQAMPGEGYHFTWADTDAGTADGNVLTVNITGDGTVGGRLTEDSGTALSDYTLYLTYIAVAVLILLLFAVGRTRLRP